MKVKTNNSRHVTSVCKTHTCINFDCVRKGKGYISQKMDAKCVLCIQCAATAKVNIDQEQSNVLRLISEQNREQNKTFYNWALCLYI